MKKIILILLLILVAVCGFVYFKKPELLHLKKTPALPYDDHVWRSVKTGALDIEHNGTIHHLYLLESLAPTGKADAQELYDVRLVITRGDTIVYDYLSRGPLPASVDEHANYDKFFIDNTLEAQDITGDHNPDLTFRSGYPGSTDDRIVMHVLVYEPGTHGFRDASSPEFYSNFNHETLVMHDQSIVVVAPTTQATCISCQVSYTYRAYRFRGNEFIPTQSFLSSRLFGSAREALETDVDRTTLLLKATLKKSS